MQLLLFLEKIIDVLDSTELVIIISRMAICVFFFFFSFRAEKKSTSTQIIYYCCFMPINWERREKAGS